MVINTYDIILVYLLDFLIKEDRHKNDLLYTNVRPHVFLRMSLSDILKIYPIYGKLRTVEILINSLMNEYVTINNELYMVIYRCQLYSESKRMELINYNYQMYLIYYFDFIDRYPLYNKLVKNKLILTLLASKKSKNSALFLVPIDIFSIIYKYL